MIKCMLDQEDLLQELQDNQHMEEVEKEDYVLEKWKEIVLFHMVIYIVFIFRYCKIFKRKNI